MNTTAVPMDAKRYELMAIINPDIGEEAINKRIEQLRKMITSAKGEIFHEEMWGMRNLAYAIKKHDKGFYVVLDFVLEPQQLKEMDATLRLEPEVLRHMFSVLPATYIPKDYTIVEEGEETDNRRKGPNDKEAPKKMETEVKAPVKAAVKSEPEKASETPKKAPKAKEPAKQNLEDVDAKLKKLLDNPDLNF